MGTIGSRIMYVLEQKNIKKIRFAEALNVSPAFVTELCAGRKFPSDRTVADICRVYNVNEDGLRDGTGEPFLQLSREDTIAAYVGKINGGKLTDIEESIIKFMAETPVEEWETLARALRRFAEAIKKPDTE